ncbi:hypothetical protein GGI23_001590 [Coemansia sp. RSA 2559]|nr:hypothetical protein GGI23_001590 [Coemansia sp. RSA 2559]
MVSTELPPLFTDSGAECNVNGTSIIERLDISVDIHDNLRPEELNERVALLFNQIFALDLFVKASQVSVNRLAGGMTNFVYSVAVDPAPMVPADQAHRILRAPTEKQQREAFRMPHKYLLRVYGTNTEIFNSRDKELFWIKQLSSRKIGPQTYGIFGNGRLEEFLESTTLTKDDIRNVLTSKQIAQRMCELHTLVGHHRPFSEDGEEQNNGDTAAYLSKKPDLWPNIDALMGFMQNNWPEIRSKCDVNAQCAGILDNWRQVEQAVCRFKTYIEKDVHSPIVFSHNDLLYNNILRLEGSGEIVLIDYEFSGYNYRGFDIANHFFTWMYDFSNLENPHILDMARYPTVEQRHNFLRAYVLARATMDADASMVGLDPVQLAEVCTTRLTEDQIREEVAALDREVASFAVVPFLQWGIFGLLKTCAGDIDIGHVDFFPQRLSWFLSQVANIRW